MDFVVPSEGLKYEEITVGAVAVGFTSALLTTAPQPKAAFVTLETANVRWRIDGTDPTAAAGHLMATTDSLLLRGPNSLSKFRAIRTGGVSGVLRVTYLVG